MSPQNSLTQERIIKHRAHRDPALSFWAEPAPFSSSFTVMGQVDGFCATERADDWFGRWEDANDFARELASSAPAPDEQVLAMRRSEGAQPVNEIVENYEVKLDSVVVGIVRPEGDLTEEEFKRVLLGEAIRRLQAELDAGGPADSVLGHRRAD